MDRPALEAAFEANRDRMVSDWKTLLAFPSISTDPAHAEDCARCAQWLADDLARIGFASRLLPSPGRPIVYAQRDGAPNKPVVLIYGHYDVQPPDPLDQWTSPPFEPTLRASRMYARGASNNKGQVWYVLKALEALTRGGEALPTIKVLIEGEEESSTVNTESALHASRDLLRSDLLMVCDAGMALYGVPTIIMGVRGVVFLSLRLSGASRNLHSGMHGGVAPNPAEAMARLLATLHTPDGRIAVDGFYDSVSEPTAKERALANAVAFDAAEYRALTGAEPVAGEKRFTAPERIGFRPTVEINGLHSGYGGPGNKTIIPAVATAKISARLVAGQDPAKRLEALEKHFRRHVQKGLTLEIPEKHIGGAALLANPDFTGIVLAKAVLSELFARPAAFRWEGGSIPILPVLTKISGASPVIVGMGSEEDNIHSPNESLSLEQFKWGYLYTGLFLSRL